MPKLTVKPSLQAYAETRAQEVVNKFSHIRPNGKRTAYEENIGLNSVQVSNTPKEAAKVLLDEFIYHDQASNWAHRKSLLSKANKTIGVGFAFEAKLGIKHFCLAYNEHSPELTTGVPVVRLNCGQAGDND